MSDDILLFVFEFRRVSVRCTLSIHDQYNFYGKTGRVTRSINNGPTFLVFSADTKEELISLKFLVWINFSG